MTNSRFVLPVLIFLAGCGTTNPTLDEINKPNWWTDNAYTEEARRCIREFGASYGSPGYEICRQNLEQQRLARSLALIQAGAAISAAGQNPGAYASPPPQPGRACFKKGEWRSGLYKNCIYRCISGDVTHTIGSTDLCPLTLD